MAVSFELRPLGATVRVAALGLAALLVAPVATASAAPARPGAVAAATAPIETVAVRKAQRGKATKSRRVVRRRYGSPAMFGAVAAGVLGAVVAGQRYRDSYEDDGVVYVQQPYGYGHGPGSYSPPPAYYGGDGYDRRYWRGGPPRHAAPQPGYVAPQPRHVAPQPGYAGPQPGYAGPRQGYGGPRPGHAGPQPGQVPMAPRGPAQGWSRGPAAPPVGSPAWLDVQSRPGAWPTPGQVGGGSAASPGM